MSAVVCPACGGRANSMVESCNGYEILACRECGLSFCDPMTAGAEPFYRTHITYRPVNASRLRMSTTAVKNRANRKLFALVPPNGRMLDIGCGIGSLVRYALDMGLDAYGIDFNTESIETGRSALNLNERLVAGNLLDLETHFSQTGTFDLVTLFEVVEHVSDPVALIRSAARQLKDGGLLALTCPNEDRWQPTGRIFVDYPPHHLTRWRPATLRRFLETQGFRHLCTRIDTTARDFLWVAYVNWSAARLLPSTSVSPISSSHDMGDNADNAGWTTQKLFLDCMLRLACWPIDLILKSVGVGTMGMRVVARKCSS